MSVEYYSCEECGYNFPDCGRYGHCKCERIFCGGCFDETTKKYGLVDIKNYGWVSDGCDICTFVTPTDCMVLYYALKLLKKERAELVQEMREAKGSL
jgi:hypothetical protein